MHPHLLWPEEGLEAKVCQGTTMGTAESGLQKVDYNSLLLVFSLSCPLLIV